MPRSFALLSAVVQRCHGCSPCTNTPSEFMEQNGKTCSGWSWGMSNRCSKDAQWVADRTCERSCDEAGNGYGGSCCPTAPQEVHVSASDCSKLSVKSCFSSIQEAVDQFPNNADSNGVILVHAGKYRNNNWSDQSPRSAGMSNGAVVSINGKQQLTITAAPGESRPIVQFDGSAGFVISNTKFLVIDGLEIEGPSDRITGAEASNNRARATGRKNGGSTKEQCSEMGCQSCNSQQECGSGCTWKTTDGCQPENRNYFAGNGIAVWSGSADLTFRNNIVHHCPGSGIRVNKGDGIVIENNVVYDNTWWTYSAPSAIVLAESKGSGSNIMAGNLVFGNRNFMPFYSPDFENIDHGGNNVTHYAAPEQDFIIDGSGVYLTRNNDYTGTFHLTDNVAYDNGINGLVVHKTNKAVVQGNKLFSNGKVSKTREMRQTAGGLVLNTAQDAVLSDNTVSIDVSGDQAFQCFGKCEFTDEGGNIACPSNAGVNSKFSAVTKSNNACFDTRSKDYMSTMPNGPQYSWLCTISKCKNEELIVN